MINLLEVPKPTEVVELKGDELLAVKNQEYICANISDAFERVVNGDGLAVVKNIGFSEVDRALMHNKVVNGEDVYFQTQAQRPGVLFYSIFTSSGVLETLEDKLLTIGVNKFLPEDYVAANGDYIIYGLDGEASFPPHYDFGDQDGVVDSDISDNQLELITVIYTVDGTKHLQVWPEGEDNSTSPGFLIEQTPDSVVVLRGGSLYSETDVTGEYSPAILHAVPPTNSFNETITFDIMPKRLAQKD